MWVCYALPDSVHLILASLITVCLFVMRHWHCLFMLILGW
jgi:hypothetical protein